MKDILKFRVFDEDNMKYFYCNPLEICDNMLIGEYFKTVPDDGDLHLDDGGIIEQCIGLTDKNKKLIYQGDVIRSFGSRGDEIKHVIVYDKENARFGAHPLPYSRWSNTCGISQQWIDEFEKEVIETIHEVEK